MTANTHIQGTETSMASIKERFGGVDTPAALMGMFTALGVLVFIGALIAAGAGSIPYQLNASDIDGNVTEIEVAGMLIAAAVIFFAFMAGGWAAGRMARYDGGINGVGVALWTLLAIAVFAALGAWVGTEYNAFQRAGLPDWFSQIRGDDVTTMGVVAAVVSSALMLLGAYLGGQLGETYHRKVDAALADPRHSFEPNTTEETSV